MGKQSWFDVTLFLPSSDREEVAGSTSSCSKDRDLSVLALCTEPKLSYARHCAFQRHPVYLSQETDDAKILIPTLQMRKLRIKEVRSDRSIKRMQSEDGKMAPGL